MDKSYSQTDSKMIQYAHDLCLPGVGPQDRGLELIRNDAKMRGFPPIHVGEFDGLHLELLVRISNASKIVEIGTLVGYSGVCLMRGMQPGGHLHSFELFSEQAQVAAQNFKNNGFSETQFTLHVGKALEQLPKIENQGPFDFIFIDADKINYIHYLSWAEQNLKQGGTVVADNTFGWNLLCETEFSDPSEKLSVQGVKDFNNSLKENPRFRFSMLPTGEGMTVAVKL